MITHDCCAKYSQIIKIADDTTAVGNEDDLADREEMNQREPNWRANY